MFRTTRDSAGTRVTSYGKMFVLIDEVFGSENTVHLSKDSEGYVYIDEVSLAALLNTDLNPLYAYALRLNLMSCVGTTMIEIPTHTGEVSVVKVKTINVGMVIGWMLAEITNGTDYNLNRRCSAFVGKLASRYLVEAYEQNPASS